MHLEAAMFELHTRVRGALRDEADLDLGCLRRIRVVLPPRTEVPPEDDAARGLPGHDPAPLAFGPVGRALEPAAARARLDHDFLRVELTDVMRVERPPAAHPAGEHLEGTLLRCIDSDRLAHHLCCRRFRRHVSSLSSVSAAALKLARAS